MYKNKLETEYKKEKEIGFVSQKFKINCRFKYRPAFLINE